MKYVISVLVCATLITAIVSMMRPGFGESVDFNPGPVISQDCKPVRLTAYTNLTAQTVNLAAVDMWMGLYKGAYADITIKLYRISDGSTVEGFQMDRYADPSGEIQRYVSFWPYTVQLAPGDGLWLDGLNCHVAGIPSPMHPQVTLYFR